MEDKYLQQGNKNKCLTNIFYGDEILDRLIKAKYFT